MTKVVSARLTQYDLKNLEKLNEKFMGHSRYDLMDRFQCLTTGVYGSYRITNKDLIAIALEFTVKNM